MPEGSSVESHGTNGHVPETSLRIADQIAADLRVMASHPPNDFQTLLFGSNAGRVVRHATIPVLTIR
ncbi:MAG: universal stress protein [Tateyamaria sp.]